MELNAFKWYHQLSIVILQYRVKSITYLPKLGIHDTLDVCHLSMFPMHIHEKGRFFYIFQCFWFMKNIVPGNKKNVGGNKIT